MKKVLFIIIGILVLSCSSRDNSSTISMVEFSEILLEAQNDKRILSNPLIVFDNEITVQFDKLDSEQKFYGEIKIVDKNDIEMIEDYGVKAKEGVVFANLSENGNLNLHEEITSENQYLMFVNGEEVSESYLQKIDSNSFISVRIIKDKDEVSKYTEKKCGGIFMIKLKK